MQMLLEAYILVKTEKDNAHDLKDFWVFQFWENTEFSCFEKVFEIWKIPFWTKPKNTSFRGQGYRYLMKTPPAEAGEQQSLSVMRDLNEGVVGCV